jgi:hypothetical protein
MALGLLIQVPCATEGADVPVNQKYCYYLAGMTLLNNDHKDNDTVKVQKYKQLSVLTGVTAKAAQTFINLYKNNPDAWQKIQTSITEIIEKNK